MDYERRPGNEFDFIDWVRRMAPAFSADVVMGPGDDCAVLRVGEEQLLLKVDSVLEGVHLQFSDASAPGYATPRQAGYKAVARAISDVAAMGGLPRFALAGTALPRGRGQSFREELLLGMLEACAHFSVRLVGGDTKTWAEDRSLILSVTILGAMDGLEPVYRSGAQPGDRLFVTGELGGSLHEKHLCFLPRVAEGRWLSEFGARCMIDLSDGISGDLRHLCRESGCGAEVWAEALPISGHARLSAERSGRSPLAHALDDGEDYELLFSVKAEQAHALKAQWPFGHTRLSEIGTFIEERELFLMEGTQRRPLPNRGYEHEF